jgi:Tol biopolymer transport system component
MKAGTMALAIGTMLTVEQRDTNYSISSQASAAISADGRFVAFMTSSPLVRADADNSSDVYVLDRQTQRVTLESADTADVQGDGTHPGISGDGRYVVFERAASVVVRDRRDGVTRIIAQGLQPAIADAGHIVAFVGSGHGRGDDVNGERTDVYVTDVHGSAAQRVSVDMAGLNPTTAASVHPSVSSDGRFVAFASRPQIDGGRARPAQVFVRDTELNITKLIGNGWEPSISGDGRFVAYTGLQNRMPQIFLADLQTGAARIITNSVRRGGGNGASGKPKVSSDGRFVVFQSEASDLVAAEDINLLWDVFVFDRATSTTSRASGDADGAWMEPSGGPSIDARGSVIAFSSRHPTDVADKRNDFDLYVVTLSSLSTTHPSPDRDRRNRQP